MMILTTERTIIRELADSDLDEFYSICCDPELMKYVGDGQPLTLQQTRGWIERSIFNYQHQGFGCWAVIDKTNNEFIGYAGLVHPQDSIDVEIIYALKKSSWGQGLASEIAKAILDYGLNNLRLTYIVATIDPDNIASIKIVEKAGMRYWKTAPDEHNLPTLFYTIEGEEKI